MFFRGLGLCITVLIALLRVASDAAPPADAGYATIASFDLMPLMDSYPAAVAVDATGNVYVLGHTRTAPAAAHHFGPGGDIDIVVAKFGPAGQIIYSTVIGGGGEDYADKILVDALGHVFIAGSFASTNFPLQNALHSTPGDYVNRFLCRIAPDGASLVYSTFLGGDLSGSALLAVTPNGQAILGGSRFSSPHGYDSDALVIRLDERGTNILFSRLIGGMSRESASAAAIDPSGAIWVVGSTSSPDFPVTPDAAQTFLRLPEKNGYTFSSDLFLLKLAGDGLALYSSLWGTDDDDWISQIRLRDDGAMFLARSVLPPFEISTVYIGSSDRPFEPELPESTWETAEFITLVNPCTGATLSEGRLPSLRYNAITDLASDSTGNAHLAGFLAQKAFVAQFDAAQSVFPRFAVFDDCEYTGAQGLAVGPAGELWFIATKFDINYTITESFLLKVTASLPPPTNRPPLVTLDPYRGSFNTPAFRGYDPGPPTITPVAADTDGTIQKVELFAGNTLLAMFTNSPYTFVWSNAPYGDYTLRAVATDNLGLSSTSCPSFMSIPAPPANNSFYRSIVISGTPATVTGTTAGATRDPGEPSGVVQYFASYAYQSRSVWWCWRAPSNGVFSVTVTDEFGTHASTVFTGTDLDHLTSLGGAPAVAFKATAGTAYYIRVTGSGDDYVLSLRPAVPPTNDDFSSREHISGAPIVLEAHNFNATFEPALSLSGGDDTASVWWTWTALSNGVYRFSAIATNPSAVRLRALRDQTPGTLPPPFYGGTSLVSRVAAGEQFHIRVSGSQTAFELRVDSLNPPLNDDRADAIALGALPVTVSGSLLGATAETNELDYSARSPVWYKWTPPPEGAGVTAEVNSDNRGASISVYRSSSGAAALEMRTSGADAPAHFHAVGGFEYWIAVDSPWGGTEDFTLTLRRPNRPPNDNFDQRIPVTEGGYGSNAEASFESLELEHLGDGETETIWYGWVAPTNGDYTLVIYSLGFSGRGAVFRQGEFDNLVPVAGKVPPNVNSRFLQFSAVAGTEYQIAFISRQNEGGALTFRIRPSDPPANDDFANATSVSGASVLVDAWNVDATIKQGSLPIRRDWPLPCGGSGARHTLDCS